MSPRAAKWWACSLFGLYALSVGATLVLVISGRRSADNLDVLLILGFAVVAALVVVREPDNRVGWLLLVAAIASGLPAEDYAYSGKLPGASLAAWMSGWLWFVWLGPVALLLPLVFPTGRLLSRRWRAAVAVAITGLALDIVATALEPGPLDVDTARPMMNPLGVSGSMRSLVTAAGIVGGVLTLAAFAIGPLSLVLRFRRSRGRERQQLKVLAYVVVGIAAMVGLLLLAQAVRPLSSGVASGMENTAWPVGLLLVILGVPFAVGFAMLRHHLYGIDVVINRTLVYGVLTVTLGAAYLASVLVLRLVLSPLTGESDLAVAGSTLAVAALFRPARSRIQSLVDRRFYRARYDATRTLETFSGRLRDEIDLEAVGADLRTVVRDTVQPAHVSLWLRSSR
jgi:hypothetical protein